MHFDDLEKHASIPLYSVWPNNIIFAILIQNNFCVPNIVITIYYLLVSTCVLGAQRGLIEKVLFEYPHVF